MGGFFVWNFVIIVVTLEKFVILSGKRFSISLLLFDWFREDRKKGNLRFFGYE